MHELVRRSARACLPDAVLSQYDAQRLSRRARKLSALVGRAETAEQRVDAIWTFEEFRPYQKPSELIGLLKQVERLRPSAICEIGAASGGTLCALSHSADTRAVIVSIDQDFTPARLKALPQLRREGQAVTCIAGDSHSNSVCSRVTSALGGQKLDVLFIDGDHSAAGVWADFEMYRGFVRHGGLIAFHDIVADFSKRFGTPTAADSGGVPAFWQQLRRQYGETREFVESPDQDGYGIGVLIWRG